MLNWSKWQQNNQPQIHLHHPLPGQETSLKKDWKESTSQRKGKTVEEWLSLGRGPAITPVNSQNRGWSAFCHGWGGGHTRPLPSLRSKKWLLERTCVFLRQSHGLASHVAITITVLTSHYSASWSVSYRIIKLTETKRCTIQRRESFRRGKDSAKEGRGWERVSGCIWETYKQTCMQSHNETSSCVSYRLCKLLYISYRLYFMQTMIFAWNIPK